ncbi:hypothetical protein [Antribacter gilvus]|uniref:hypothetical protein n=1 Tax=Antribacter gilvus TaxID=2304675 RepID=UPI000F7A9688|nr:hypothetical protein [Antribacter gilvus]
MTIHSTTGGTRTARTARTTRAGLVLGATVCVAALVAGCDPAGDPGAAPATSPAPATSASSTETTAPAAADAPASTTIPFEDGRVPDGWSERDGVACGMSATDLATQDDRFQLELDGPMVSGADGTAYQPVLLRDGLGDDAAVDFGDEVQLVWSQGGVVVDLDDGWYEGGGPILLAADAQGLPTDEYSVWKDEVALRWTSGLAQVSIATSCWPDAPRPDGEYELRAVALAMADGASHLVVSEPVIVEWVGPAVG